MKKYLLLLVVCVMSMGGAELAAEPAKPVAAEKPAVETTAVETTTPDPAASPELPAVDQENLKQLVETLESETARTEFINNLKTLMDQQKAEEQAAAPALPLTEQIGVRSFISDSVNEYENFLTRNNLSGSLVNQVLGSVVTLIFMVAALTLEKKLLKKIIRGTDKLASRFEVSVTRLRTHVRFLNALAQGLIYLITLYTLAKIWGFTALDHIFESAPVRSAISSGVTVLLVVFLAALVWEAISIYLEYILRKADTNNQTRAKTLLPIIRNIVVAIFAGLFGLVLLSELGINVTPLLAGAGVIGVAVGFGAQSMVKDFLSGFTIILEDIVRVGDVVNLGGASGVVEKITLRKIQLRDFAGTVYTIPYSEIKIIQNLTKDFSFYVMDISVAYDASIDHVISVLRQVGEDLRKDDSFGFMILEPLEIAGVDKFADSAIVIKARIKTQPIRQWTVGREFNKRMKIAFDKEGIEIPFPQRTINLRGATDAANDPGVSQAILEEAAD